MVIRTEKRMCGGRRGKNEWEEQEEWRTGEWKEEEKKENKTLGIGERKWKNEEKGEEGNRE